MITIYQYPKCSTCRQALKWLEAHAIPFQAIDIVAAPPNVKQLKLALSQSGLPIQKFFNVSGQSYREGGFKERLQSMTEAESLAALAGDGKLIKRPLLIADGCVLVGFDATAYGKALRALR